MHPRMLGGLKARNDDIQSREAVQSTESEKVCKIKEFCLRHEAGETELTRSHSNRRQMKPAGPLFGVFSNRRLRLSLPPSYRPTVQSPLSRKSGTKSQPDLNTSTCHFSHIKKKVGILYL